MDEAKDGWIFFCSYQTRCHSVGIEYNERIYAKAVENKETAVSAERVDFVVENAEQFPLPAEVDRIYFFNPFSLEILRKVMARIRESYYEKPRQMKLYFYYPSDEYMAYLMTVEELTFLDEIDCRDYFQGTIRESGSSFLNSKEIRMEIRNGNAG